MNQAHPGTPRSDTPHDEYKSIREEMLQLFNRVFVILAAELAAFTTLTGVSRPRTWSLRSSPRARNRLTAGWSRRRRRKLERSGSALFVGLNL